MSKTPTYEELILKVGQLEQELRIQKSINRNLNTVVENSPAAIVITNAKGVIEYVNPAFTTITGYTEEESIGMHTKVLKSGWHSQEYFQAMWNTLNSGKPWKDIFYNKKKNGDLYWEQQFIGPIFNEIGEIDHFMAIKLDITTQKIFEDRLKSSEEYLDAITKAIPELFFVVDEDGKILDIIAANERLLYAEASKIKEKRLSEIMPPNLSTKFTELIKTTIEKQEIQTIEYELPVSGDRTEWFEGRSAPLGIKLNDRQCMVFVARDITEQKENEKRLKELILTKDKFFSIIAHDLKNPFNALLGISELLYTSDYEYDVQQVKELSKIINESSRNAYELLENLLQWSRSQTGQIKFSPKEHNLKELVEQSVRVIEGQAFNKMIKVNNQIDPNELIYADGNLLRTIIRNMVSNSIKFTNPGGYISIHSNKKNGHIQVTIEDNGIGMNEQLISQLFKLESKYSSLGTSNERGTGLGLILCKEFIEMHKGMILVESTVGKGSKFTISLPSSAS